MKNKKLILSIGILLIFLAFVSLSYAYFDIKILNNDVKDQVVETGSLILKYTDGPEIIAKNIEPGWSVTKTVTVENKGSLETFYNLNWKDLTNEIIDNELVYSVQCESNNSFCRYANISETVVPSKSGIITEKVAIYPGEIQTFTINITFSDLEVSQDYNQGKKFSGVLNIVEFSQENNKYDVNIQLLDSSFSEVSNYSIQFDSNSVITNDNGYALIKDVSLGNHSLVIKDSSDNILDTKKITISESKIFSIDDNNIVASVMGDNVSFTINLDQNNKIKDFSNKMITPSECFAFSEGTITDYYNTKDGCPSDVVIPEKINNVDVTSIGSNALQSKKINSIIFSSKITKLDAFSLSNNNLIEVEIPSNIETLMGSVFEGNQLSDVIIHDGVVKIGSTAFYSNFINDIYIPTTVTSIGYGTFNQNKLPDDKAFIYARNSDGSEDKTKIVSYGGNNPNIIIPDGVTNIYLGAFSGVPIATSGFVPISNFKIESVYMPDTVTSIEMFAFYKNNISSVTLSNNLTSISSNAFANNNLTEVTIPNSVTSIGSNAFTSNNLVSISIPNNVTSIDFGAFSSNNLTSISIPSSVTTLGNSAFSNNKVEGDAAFIYARNNDGGEDKTTINSYAGSNKKVVIPDGVVSLAASSFQNTGIKEVSIPNSVTTIGSNAFANNELVSIKIPDNVTSIGRMAFYGNKLVSVNIPSKLTKIDELVFAKNRLTNIDIPSTITSIGASAFNVNLLSDDKAFIYARNSDGSIDKTKIVSYGGGNRDVVVPNGVTIIDRYAFYIDKLKSIILPEGLKTINDSALSGNIFETITIPSSVMNINTNIGDNKVFKNVIIKGKSSSSDFTTYKVRWLWAKDVTCVKNNTSNVTNGCITWEK